MKRKRVLALALTAAIALGNIPVYAQQGAGSDEPAACRVLLLDFEGNVNDSIKTDRITAMKKWVDGGAQPAVEGSDYSYAEGINSGTKALQFGGGSYLSLGNEADLNPASLTFAFWINPGASPLSGEQILVWNKGEWNQDGWYLSSLGENQPLVLSVGTRVFEAHMYANRAEVFPANTWTHVAVTFDNGTKQAKFYINGVEKASFEAEAADVIATDSSIEKAMGYNGPVYKDSYLKAAIDQVVLMDMAADTGMIEALYEEKKEGSTESMAQEDADAIYLPSTVYSDLNLPMTGSRHGSTITWESGNPDIIGTGGKVNVPDGAGTTVTLTATVTYGQGSEAIEARKEFTVTVKKMEMTLYNNMMDDVTLSDAYLLNAQEKDIEYLLSMNSKKFLYEFYKVAGLTPPTTEGYAGWERSNEVNFRGHFVGHYFSALSQAYLSSHDLKQKAELLVQIEDAVDGLKECQDAYSTAHPESAGYISAFCESALDAVQGTGDTDENVLVPWYNLHKVLAGVIDIAKNVEDKPELQKKAMEVACGFGDYIYYSRTSKWDEGTKLRILGTEYGGMNEALYELYNLTGDEHYKSAAECFDETVLFKELAAGNDVLAGKHANTTIPKFIGAAKRYQVLSNSRFGGNLSQEDKGSLKMYLTAAENFWDIVTAEHTYITGGNSQSEHFHEADVLAGYMDNRNCETCNTYNMLKLSRILFQITKDKKYMDYYENAFINAILSSQNPESGMMMYFQPMKAGYYKLYNSKYEDFWCCTGTGVENFTKLGDTIYLDMGADVYVNMYFASTYDRNGLGMKVEANMPASEEVKVTITKNDQDKAVRFRIPDWIPEGKTVSVQGADYREENGYLVLEGLTAGTELTLTLPMEAVAYDLPDNPDVIAFKYGPIALSCGLGTNGLDKEEGAGILVRAPQADKAVNGIVIVSTDSVGQWKENLAENLVRMEDSADGQVQFRLENTNRPELVYTPHYRQYQQRYGLYMTFASGDSQVLQDMLLKEKQAMREKEAASDIITVFDDNNTEWSHNLKTSGYSGYGTFGGRMYRDSNGGGWFSHDLVIDEDAPVQYLNTTYTTADNGRTFDIYINDELFAHETITNTDVEADEEGFYTVCRQIPEEYLTGAKTGEVKEQSGKPVITVKIQSTGGPAGGLYGISVTKDYDTEAALESVSVQGYFLNPEFDPDITEYTVTVPAGTEEIVLNTSPGIESGLVYSGDVLYDDAQPRTFKLEEGRTVITLNTKAQDHQTARMYVVIVEKE